MKSILWKKKYVHPHIIVSFEGFSGTFYLIILLFVLNQIGCKIGEDIYMIAKSLLNIKEPKIILYLLGLLISFVIYNICRSLTNFNFSPSYRAIADTFSFNLTWISKFILPSLGMLMQI